jgi:hypothetical protein
MNPRTSIASLAAGFALAFAASAAAQNLGALKDVAGGLDPGALASGSVGNAAGIIQYCMANNFLEGEAVSSVKDNLVTKLGGAENAEKDSGYAAGVQGKLIGGDGKTTNFDDFGGSLESELKRKACSAVFDHAKSLL